jgi:hypothetical protein
MLTYDLQGKCLRLRLEGRPDISWRLAIEADGATLRSEDADVDVTCAEPLALRLRFPGAGLTWTIRSECSRATGTIWLHSSLTNSGSSPVALGKVDLFRGDLPGLGERSVFLPCMPGQEDRPVFRLADEKAPRWSKVKIQFFDPAGPTAVQVGFQTLLRANTEIRYRWAVGAVRDLAAYADFAGWGLPSGESTPVETFVLAVGADPYAQLERWAERVGATSAVRRWEGTPLGWLGWTWVDAFNSENYEATILRNCEAINRRLGGFGFGYVWLSIGNLPGGHPGAWMGWHETNFPNGPESLVRRLDALGFKLGLWCGPFWISAHLEQEMAELREALVRNPDGSLHVSLGRWNYGDCANLPKEQRPALHALDPTHPKTLAFLEKAFALNRRRGVRYYMIDFLYAGAGNINGGASPAPPTAPLHDPGVVPGPEAFQKALHVIRRAAGDDTYLLASTGPTLHTATVADGVRTGNDFGEGRPIARDSYFYPATYVVNSASFWTACLPALRNQAAAYYTHRRLYLNDSGNVLSVDKPIPLSDARIHATIHAMSGGPSMLGDDVDRMDDERLALIKKTLPRPSDVAFPLDLFDAPFPDHPKLFHRRVTRPWGRFDVLAVYNFSAEPLRQAVPLARLGLPEDSSCLVWEFWDCRYEGRARGHLNVDVPPGSVKVYRLVVDEDRPTLLGTDMHLLMGEAEVLECAWDPEDRTLRGRASRPSGERGSVFIHAPETLRVAEPRGLWVAKDGRDKSLIVRCALKFEGGTADWCVRFAPVG